MRYLPEQLSFPGLDPRPTDRLFFAIYPDAPATHHAADVCQCVCRDCGLTGRPLASYRFHVSLHFLGDYRGLPKDVVAQASDAASTVTRAPFDVAFDRAGSFLGRRRKLPLVLRAGGTVTPLIAFQLALGEAMACRGLARWVSRRYTPHMTLLYDARCVETRAVEPVEWTVREFVLVHSLLRRTRHIPLARWPLGGADSG